MSKRASLREAKTVHSALLRMTAGPVPDWSDEIKNRYDAHTSRPRCYVPEDRSYWRVLATQDIYDSGNAAGSYPCHDSFASPIPGSFGSPRCPSTLWSPPPSPCQCRRYEVRDSAYHQYMDKHTPMHLDFLRFTWRKLSTVLYGVFGIRVFTGRLCSISICESFLENLQWQGPPWRAGRTSSVGQLSAILRERSSASKCNNAEALYHGGLNQAKGLEARSCWETCSYLRRPNPPC